MKTIQSLITATDISHPDVVSGDFTATQLTMLDTSAFLYDTTTVTKTGSVRIREGAYDETVRVIQVVNSTTVVVEQLINTASYTTNALITPLAYDGTPGLGELAKNSATTYLYPSLIRADQGINCDREDLKELNDNITLGSIYFKNMSQGIILKVSSSSVSTVQLQGTPETPLIYGRESNLFLEDAVKSLDLLTVSVADGFIDIYVQQDNTDTPMVTGTLPMKLVGKYSGLLPDTTSAIANQYLIAHAYLYQSTIIGIHNLETPNVPLTNSFKYTSNPFNFSFSATSFELKAEKPMCIPVFVDSIITIDLAGTISSDTAAADEINFDLGLSLDATAATAVLFVRESPMAVTTKVWKGNWSISTNLSASPGLNIIYLAGMVNDGLVGTGKTYFLINRAVGKYKVHDSKFIFNSEV
jgi:hypothetical protein